MIQISNTTNSLISARWKKLKHLGTTTKIKLKTIMKKTITVMIFEILKEIY